MGGRQDASGPHQGTCTETGALLVKPAYCGPRPFFTADTLAIITADNAWQQLAAYISRRDRGHGEDKGYRDRRDPASRFQRALCAHPCHHSLCLCSPRFLGRPGSVREAVSATTTVVRP